MEPFRVEFTALAKAIAQTHYSLEIVEAKVRADIMYYVKIDAETQEDGGIPNIGRFGCLMVSMDSSRGEAAYGEDNTLFYCDSVEPNVLRIDLGEFEDAGEIKEGPFAGKRVMVPRRMSDDIDTRVASKPRRLN